MTDTRFKPPAAQLEARDESAFEWGVAWLGAAAATGANYLLGFLISPILQWSLSPPARSESAIYQALLASPVFMLVTLALAVAGYTYGGFVVAALAPQRPMLHALVSGAICILIGAVGYAGLIQSPLPGWVQVLGFLITLPCFYAGVRVRRGRLPGQSTKREQ